MNLLRRFFGAKDRSKVKRNTYPLSFGYTNTDIMNGSHWKVTGVNRFASFFRALPFLVPNNSILCLEAGHWDRVQNILDSISLNMESEQSTAPGDEGYYVSITEQNMAKLAELAEHSDEMEIALHLAVLSDDEKLLEWFDLPEDPIYISEIIEREFISRFAESVGGKYQKIIFCDDCTVIDV